MAEIGNTFLYAVGSILHQIINLYIWVVIIAALISWVRPDPYSQIVQILYRLTEPAYAFIRRFIPTVISGIDLAPLILIIGLQFVDLFFVRLIMSFA